MTATRAALTAFIIVLFLLGLLILAATAEAKVTERNVENFVHAPQGTVDWALKWRRIAVREWERWNRARACFGMRHVRFDGPKPPRRASKPTWFDAGRAWKHRVPVYVAKTEKLRWRMAHPRGGVARWLPLAHWVGWSRSQDAALTLCMTLESGGRPWAVNGCYHGLLQINGGSFNAESNLRQGYRLWRARGWQPWPPMTARGFR